MTKAEETMHADRLKVYAAYTDSHASLFEDFFVPSLANTDLELHATKAEQSGDGDYGSGGYLQGILLKVNTIINAIKENFHGVFVFSDVDIIFFKKVSSDLLSELVGKDIVFQSEGYRKGEINSGFFVCRANERTLQLWEECERRVRLAASSGIKRYDQEYIYDILREGITSTKFGYLPMHKYTFFKRYIPGSHKFLLPRSVHTYHAIGTGLNSINNKKNYLLAARNHLPIPDFLYFVSAVLGFYLRYLDSKVRR